jgi:GTP-binding protein
MITRYLERRTALRGVVAIVDAEVGATEDDVRTLAYLVSAGRRVLVAATKLDRLAKARRKPRLAAIAERLSVPRDTVLGFSATERLGVPEVWESLWAATS